MSNWSVVMVCWSGLDDAASGSDDHESRVALVTTLLQKAGLRGPVVAHGCPHEESVGSAVEWVLVFHCNHFSPEKALFPLSTIRWSKPEEVQVIWKDEEMDGYEIETLEATA